MNKDNENILRTVFEDLAHQIWKLPVRLSSLYDMESMAGTDKQICRKTNKSPGESEAGICANLAQDKVNVLDQQEQDGLFNKCLGTNGYLFLSKYSYITLCIKIKFSYIK